MVPVALLVRDGFRWIADSPVQESANSHAERARVWEQYRLIRTRILQHGKQPSSIVVSSPGIGDGKTTTSLYLAMVFAFKRDEPVLLIDADLRAPTIHSGFHVPGAPGVAEVLSGKCGLMDAVRSTEELPNLYVLPAGEALANPTDLLTSNWQGLIGSVRQKFQRVIVDCPPARGPADYDLIAAQCDGVVMVVRPDHTNRAACLETLAKARDKLVGVVVNEARDWFLWKRFEPFYSPVNGSNGHP